VASGSVRFEDFVLDTADRQLRRGGTRVDLNGRYFDALALLVSDAGKLVSKDRFMDEVWRGVPVTDEALTQCIRTIRRQLGDDAAQPRFIETIPKHGYRFIAPVERADSAVRSDGALTSRWHSLLVLGSAGTAGGAFAGLLGGLFYGFAASGTGIGSASVVLVLLSATLLVALIGGAGVSFGIAVAGPKTPWAVAGGAVGGLVVGAVVKLLGTDALNLLFGGAPGDVTGAAEGTLLGGAVGLGAWLAWRLTDPESPHRGAAIAALVAGSAGMLLAALGGRMMGGSLDLLARSFPNSRLQLDQLGALFGESGFGPVTQVVTGGLEAALFGGCVVGGMLFARRAWLQIPD
jgi:DNA-binding winged helix-turn-helix (wHTH) protein